MKTRFDSYDIVCIVSELQKLIGMRVNNVYDIDNKTYLIRLQRGEEKSVLLLESGNRIHTTSFEWPKNVAPSGFSMKMRKHLRNKRLESLVQLGTDRIIELQFGTSEAAYHVILELYDRGNIVLTDWEMVILNVLRPHTEGDKVKFAVREKYPQDRGREKDVGDLESLRTILASAKVGEPLRKVLVPNLDYGPALTEHVLMKHRFMGAAKIGKTFDVDDHIREVLEAIKEGKSMMDSAKKETSKGYIIQKKEERPSKTDGYYYSNQDFHPFLFMQHATLPHREYETFNMAVDEYYSTMEGQKIELRALNQERDAMKKLDNIRKDHDQRLNALEKAQETDKQKAELITRNQQLVEAAILAIHSALASQVSWTDIDELVKEAGGKGDPIAKCIKQLKLDTNHISLYLTDPYDVDNDGSDDTDDDEDVKEKLPSAKIDIDLGLSAFANARRYYDQKRHAAKKQQKTIESQGKALKSAEKKTKQTLKEVQAITNINKARKVYWFEKFFWFISSENYLVIAGRDQQQNELIVKRYMRPHDVYVHADIHGASSVIIKNPSALPVPPKTLNEAGTMAICYSVAWDAKVVTNAYWVLGEQVTKTAPTGEYLTTGSFMVRGKKNFLPPSHLVLGLSFLFRLEEGSVERHRGERRVLAGGEEAATDDVEHVELELIEEANEEGDGKSGDSDSDDGENARFPDTQIKIQHSEGTKIEIVAAPLTSRGEEPAEGVVYLGDDVPVSVRHDRVRPKAPREGRRGERTISEASEPRDDGAKPAQAKRGQKSKLKKIKEKYKDQDDEERQLRMNILQSAGAGKEPKSKKKAKEVSNGKKVQRPLRPFVQKSEQPEEADEDEPTAQADVDMVDAMTGQPLPEDELLFAIPVIAPYNTLANYKFKVKLTPGTSRRGKAARTAVGMFLKDRSTTQREKDLLRAVKDEQLARNLPGKVKLSAPRLQALRK